MEFPLIQRRGCGAPAKLPNPRIEHTNKQSQYPHQNFFLFIDATSLTIENARKAKVEFLESLFEYILGAYEVILKGKKHRMHPIPRLGFREHPANVRLYSGQRNV